MAQAREALEKVAQNPQQTPEGKALAQVLLAILAGQRAGALADREGIDFRDAVEVELLLAQLARAALWNSGKFRGHPT